MARAWLSGSVGSRARVRLWGDGLLRPPHSAATVLIFNPNARATLKRFGAFLTADSRYDLWIRSETDKDSPAGATLVWDRHNLLYAYGPLDRFAAALTARGFEPGRPSMDFEHIHHYRPRFDEDAAAWREAFDWSWSPLREADYQ
jgi:hypothetical protein